MFQLRIKDFLKYWIFLILLEVILVHFLYLKFKEYLNYLPLLSSFFLNELPLFIEILITDIPLSIAIFVAKIPLNYKKSTIFTTSNVIKIMDSLLNIRF